MAHKIKVTCPQCNGNKVKIYPGTVTPTTCRYCGGEGTVDQWVEDKPKKK